MSGSYPRADTSMYNKVGTEEPRNPFTWLNQFGEMWRGQNATQKSNIDLSQTKRQAAYSQLLPLLSVPPDQMTMKHVTDIAARAERQGIPMAHVLNDLAAIGGARGAALHRELMSRILPFSQTDAANQLGAINPQPFQLNTGQQTVFGTRGPAALGGLPVVDGKPRGALDMQIDPATGAQRVQVGTDARGNPIMGPLQSATPRNLGGTAGSIPGNGGYPVAPANNPALIGPGGVPSPRSGMASPPGADPRGFVTMPGPAMQAAGAVEGDVSEKTFQQYVAEGAQAANQIATLQGILNKGELYNTGLGHDWWKTAAKLISQAVPWSTPGLDKKIASAESMEKMMNELVSAANSTSDARMHVTQGANPNMQMNPESLKAVLSRLLGNQDYLRARAEMVNRWTNDPYRKTDRIGFENQVNANLDPQVFQYHRLSPQQKGDYMRTLQAADPTGIAVQSFIRNYGWAKQAGLLPGGAR
jgi:hypothetical protein